MSLAERILDSRLLRPLEARDYRLLVFGAIVSLLGDGSTLAMTAAHTLATALNETPGDPARALRDYENRHRRLVTPKQRRVGRAAALLVPAGHLGLAARNLGARLLAR